MEKSATFGISLWTRQPLQIAASELSSAISTLDRHHEIERDGFAANLDAARGKLASATESEGQAVGPLVAQLTESAQQLRSARAMALETLLALREPLADLLLEAHEVKGAGLLVADVEADLSAPVPVPADGVDVELRQWAYVLAQTLKWTRDETHRCCLLAMPPAYLLAKVIEHPTPEASKLRQDARDAHKALVALDWAAVRIS